MSRLHAWALVAAVAVGCGPSSKAIEAWETHDELGPEKLGAVVADAKAKPERRKGAALALARLTRRGRHVGLDVLLGALAKLPAAEQRAVVSSIAGELVEETTQRRPAGEAKAIVDRSLPAKDCVYGIVARDLAGDAALKERLRGALLRWIASDTVARFVDRGQRYSVEQVARLLGAPAVAHFPELFAETVSLAPTVASLVAELGDPATVARALEALVAEDERRTSPAFLDATQREIAAYNAKSGMRPTNAQLAAQVALYVAQQRTSLLEGLALLGGRGSVEALLARATDARTSERVRGAALAAASKLRRELTPADLERVATMIKDDKQGSRLRAKATEWLIEMGAKTPLLLGLFHTNTWEIRSRAARAILAAASAEEIAALMKQLPVDDEPPMGPSEPLVYGVMIAQRPQGRELLRPYLSSKALGPRLVALGGFHGGRPADRAELERFANDPTPLPTSYGTVWRCASSTPPLARVTTIGQLVRLCLLPTLGGVDPEPPQPDDELADLAGDFPP